ncbi:hypothetical protein [uncultured Desulfovibrio sp.]|nr:hypothetical protein [uncultured Desulfovibrio sp.]
MRNWARRLIPLLCLMALLAACGQNAQVRAKGQTIVGVGVGSR